MLTETDALIASDMGDSKHLSEMEALCRRLERERDKLRSVVDELFWLARMADYDSQRSDEAINSYNKLPHVIERKTK